MEESLLSMIHEVDKKRRQLEEECKILKGLLRPWPRKKSEPLKTDDGNNNKEELCKKEDALSAEEKQALLRVEKLLQKAQITRQVKSKDKTSTEKSSSSAAQEEASTDLSKSVSRLSPEDSLASGLVLDGGRTTNSKVRENSDSHASTGDRQTRSKAAAVQRGSTAGSLAKNNARTFNTRVSHKPERLAMERSKKVTKPSQSHRPVSQQPHRPSRPASGRNRPMPVHMTAPFKTEENLKMPPRKTMQSHLPPKNSSTKPRPGSGLSSHSYRALPAIRSSRGRDSDHTDDVKFEDKLGEETSASPFLEDCVSSRTLQPDRHDSVTAHYFVAEETPGAAVASSPSPSPSPHPVEDLSGLQEPEEEPFTLKTQGSSLKIPGKLAKLVSTNSSLREQCSASQLLKKVSPGDSGQNFIERLQGEWEISEELWTRVRAITCVRAHKMLLDMIYKLNLAGITGQSSYQELYTAKRTLEFVLSMFASLQEESDYLSHVQFRDVDYLSSNLSTVDKQHFKDVFSLVGQSSEPDWDVAEHLRGSEQWADLKFSEEHLQLQLWQLGLVQAEWWHASLLETRDPTVLQSLYSLLSSGGQFLPAFVTNKI